MFFLKFLQTVIT